MPTGLTHLRFQPSAEELRALSHECRAALLLRLDTSRVSLEELAGSLDHALPERAISFHLGVLQKAGLVERRREATSDVGPDAGFAITQRGISLRVVVERIGAEAAGREVARPYG